MELMRSVIVQSTSYHGHLLGPNKGSVSISVSPSNSAVGVTSKLPDDRSESATSHSDPSQSSYAMMNNGTEDSNKTNNSKQNVSSSEDRSGSPRSPTPSTTNSQGGDSYWRAAMHGGKQASKKVTRTHSIVVTGPAGYVSIQRIQILRP
jgi:hypothetical protein